MSGYGQNSVSLVQFVVYSYNCGRRSDDHGGAIASPCAMQWGLLLDEQSTCTELPMPSTEMRAKSLAMPTQGSFAYLPTVGVVRRAARGPVAPLSGAHARFHLICKSPIRVTVCSAHFDWMNARLNRQRNPAY